MRTLRAGSTIAVVAPAGPFDREELFRGLAWLASRYRLRLQSTLFDRYGFLAGGDDVRAGTIASAMMDPEVDAIFCARGGYGAMRVIDRLPWREFAARPKPIVGFSDVTALHLVANGMGLMSVHGPNVTGLGRGSTPHERHTLLAALEGLPLEAWDGLSVVHAGPPARGVVIGGNLALVEAMAAASRLAIPEGAILVLEDVGERPYRIDRMLTALRMGGHLSSVAGIVFGEFTRCDAGPDGTSALDVLRERTESLGIPIACGAPIGHGTRNLAFRLGVTGYLRGSRLEWDLGGANQRTHQA